MIGFSIEFKRWYFVLRGPRGRVYLATGFAKRMPVMTPTGTYDMEQYIEETSMFLDIHRYEDWSIVLGMTLNCPFHLPTQFNAVPITV